MLVNICTVWYMYHMVQSVEMSTTSEPRETTSGTVGPRERLLGLAVDHVAEHGISDLSLRQLAAAIGTSHRMLIYHFGSKEELMVAIVNAVEARTREASADLAVDIGDPRATMRAVWAMLSAPENHGHERLFFELYGMAIQGHPNAQGMLDGLVSDWLEPLTHLEVARGVPEPVARANVRIGVALMRGLLLDLLATGDNEAIDEAFDHFITHYDPS